MRDEGKNEMGARRVEGEKGLRARPGQRARKG
jgi:hypothetical protein